MLFNSFSFIVFFSVFILGWPFARKNSNTRWLYLLFFSLFFYGWWDWRYVFLLIATASVDFAAGLAIHYYRKYSRSILWVSICTNLFVLGYFKYSLFFAQSANAASDYLGLGFELPLVSLILPVGISFYTFQSMSYTIDVYNKKCEPTHNILHFLSAISMFAQLVAGPIIRASDLLPQLLTSKAATSSERQDGLRLIAHGLFKKVVIADNLSATINSAFAGPVSAHSGLEWWIIVTMFAMQIYCDFSGYSDIARGLARWIGYDFAVNFSHPYSARSLQDFWGRWHMSLSTWFRDYVYIPLGGSRKGKMTTYRNIAITMVLSGFWHGAGFTYIVWGALHAAFLSIERLTQWPRRLIRLPLGSFAMWVLVLVQVWVAWVFFRATSVEQSLDILSAMFTPSSVSIALSSTALVYLVLGICHEIYTYKTDGLVYKKNIKLPEFSILVLVLVSCVFLRGPGNAFIYFQF